MFALSLDRAAPPGRHHRPRRLLRDGTPENLRVLCRAHNQFAAEQAFGREHIEQQVHLRRNKSRAKAAPLSKERDEPTNQHRLLELAVRALTSMGFREPEARRAVAGLNSRTDTENTSMTIENILRHALAILTSNPTPLRQRK